MKFSERWLRAYANPAMTSDALAHALTMAGLEVEERTPAAPPFSGVVVGHVLAVERHPNADKLNVCRVDVGAGEPQQIVCGAPNVAAGMKAPCALPGAELPGGMKIGVATMRGVESRGMLCSARELGLSEDHAGLLSLDASLEPGAPLRDALALDDMLWLLKLTPNLAHCMSVTGVAREVAAVTGAPLNLPAIVPVTPQLDERLPVRIEAPELCGRFSGRVIRGVDARAATPAWMRERLERSGQRSISALVDISNYVMLELGRPTHVFDLAKIRGGLTVRWGRPGERLELLNGNTVELGPDEHGLPVGVIADAQSVESLAGIMGGEATAVTLDTTDIYVEAAFWWPTSIAGRARRYNFSTDAAQRFERGVDAATTVEHLEYLSRLIVDVCGGKAGPVDDTVTGLPERKPVSLRVARARKVIGADIGLADCTAAFDRLALDYTVARGVAADGADAVVTVSPPTRRFDLEIEEDLIEEVVRIWGFERLPVRPPRASASMRPVPEDRRSVSLLKRIWADRDWQEVVNFAFVSNEVEALLAGEGGGGPAPIGLLNPIAETMDVMRTSLWGGLLGNLRHNQNRKAARVRLFEVGRVFLRDAGAPGGPLSVPGIAQPWRVGGLAWGPALDEQWGATSRAVDFFDVKADLEAVAGDGALRFEAAVHPALHPGQAARLRDAGGRTVGWLGALHPRLVRPLDLSGLAPVLFELDLDVLLRREVPSYREFSRFPPAIRDLAFVLPEGVPAAELLADIDALRRSDTLLKSLQDVRLFDEYRGKGLENKEKSLAFRFWMQDTQRTLEDAEVDAAMRAITARLGETRGARLRSS
ncbi:MAG: Phenylalanine--tRNA ligase beta subunit [Pseudomonadota bacterium]|jgi:phenylalanyl-tRNA synthetase beta chain